jgi:choline dehydrogenase
MEDRRPLRSFDDLTQRRNRLNPFANDSDPSWWRNCFRITALVLLILLFGLCIAAVVGIFTHKSHTDLCRVVHTDHLVVGGGSAGIIYVKVLADAGLKSLLMEAGTDDPDDENLSVPHNNGGLVLDHTNPYFWQLGHATDQGGFRFPGVQGRKTGGGSRVNGMQYVRGVNETYDRVAAIVGDSSWGSAAWIEAYKWIENMLDTTIITNTAVHGYDGAVDIRLGCTNVATATNFVNAANSAFGNTVCPVVADYNDPDTEVGASIYWQLFQTADKTRASTSSAYLDPILDCQREGGCPNPVIMLKTTAHHIIWDGLDAVGVEGSSNGECVRVMAKESITLSMGVQSPLMLQRSGYGPKTLLDSVDVPVKFDNPNVGARVLNHPIIALTATGSVNATSDDSEGLYTGVVFKKDDSLSTTTRAIEMIGIASPGAFTIATLLLNATSAGTWTIINSDPLTMPQIVNNYFSMSADIATGVAAIHDMLDIFDEMGLTPTVTFADDTEIEDYLLAHYSQAYHWVGGSRLGASVEEGGVVDTDCAVMGVNRLYVADTSIMPVQNTGNTDAPGRAIGKMCADKMVALMA